MQDEEASMHKDGLLRPAATDKSMEDTRLL